jgi:hypothetical protein
MSILHAFMILSVVSTQPERVEVDSTAPPSLPSHQVRSLRVTVLSTMLTDFHGVGEWGFAALVEVDGRRLLFDTGARPETVLDNARGDWRIAPLSSQRRKSGVDRDETERFRTGSPPGSTLHRH